MFIPTQGGHVMASGKHLIDEIESFKPQSGQLGVWWLGQLGFVIKSIDGTISVDAFISQHAGRQVNPLLSPEHFNKVDLVLGTHDHSDHIDRPAWKMIALLSSHPKFVVPELVKSRIAKACWIDEKEMMGIDDQQSSSFGNITITGIASAHEFLEMDEASGKYPHLGYVIQTGGRTIYHSGDCCIYEGLLTKLNKWKFDVVFLPINGRDAKRYAGGCLGNMTFQEAADLAGSLAPGLTIPGHFDMFIGNQENPQQFIDYMKVKYPECQAIIPEYGKRIEVSTIR
jgi:L-ascorbate 6-phosphate lactonase